MVGLVRSATAVAFRAKRRRVNVTRRESESERHSGLGAE